MVGLPHPSGANAERIAFFLERKRREDLSAKVDPVKLVAARTALVEKVSQLPPRRGADASRTQG